MTLPPTSDTSVPPKPGSLPPEALERMRHHRHDRLVACMSARNVPNVRWAGMLGAASGHPQPPPDAAVPKVKRWDDEKGA